MARAIFGLASSIALSMLAVVACQKRQPPTQVEAGSLREEAGPAWVVTDAGSDAQTIADASEDPVATVPGSFRVVVVGETPSEREKIILQHFEKALRKVVGAGTEMVLTEGGEREEAERAADAKTPPPSAALPESWRSKETVVALRVASARGGIARNIGNIVIFAPPLAEPIYRERVGDVYGVPLHISYVQDVQDVAKRIAKWCPSLPLPERKP
jgi:hypothetical protein